MDILEKLFGGSARVKIMKLFLLNQDKIFDKSAVMKQAKVAQSSISREIGALEKMGFLKKKSFFKENKIGKKKRVQGYILNPTFRYIAPLQRLLIDSAPMEHKEIVNHLANIGKLKLVIISGVFLQERETRIDLLIVGDDLSSKRVKNSISNMEAEIGRQLKYSVFDTNDFKYRMGMFDRLIRDIFDYPHEVVIDKIGL